MADGFIGEIKCFAGNFAPRSWAFCQGQLLPIAQNSALFSILGTIYGGDGRTTFALPDLRGRAAVSAGAGPGLSNRQLGGRFGSEQVTINAQTMASHSHGISNNATTAIVDQQGPTGNIFGVLDGTTPSYTDVAATGQTGGQTLGLTGGNMSHNNIPPYQAINWIICLYGIYPSRS